MNSKLENKNRKQQQHGSARNVEKYLQQTKDTTTYEMNRDREREREREQRFNPR